jgi:hypothetical protein
MPQLIAMVDDVEIYRTYLTRDRTSLGRRPTNHIVLSDLAVSGEHCAFELKGLADVEVHDLASTNGTYINGKMIDKHMLQDGDVIAIGKFKIHYHSANELTDESQTTAMALETGVYQASTGALQASLKVLTGSSAGLELPVVKAVSTFGKRGVAMVAIAHRRQGYFISCMESIQVPTLNGRPLSEEPVMLEDYDVLELAGTTLEFALKP